MIVERTNPTVFANKEKEPLEKTRLGIFNCYLKCSIKIIRMSIIPNYRSE